jgi:hypothetical protein
MIIMNLGVPMRFILRNDEYISPNYVSITKEIVASSGATTTFNIISTSGSAISNRTIASSGITKGGGAGACTSCGPIACI